MPVTLKDVAMLAGVSVSTVNQVLKPQPGRHYSEATCKKVMDAANQLGYRPNGYAQAMRAGRFNSVALLLSTEKGHSTIPSGLIDGLLSALEHVELHLNVSRLPDAKLTHEGYLPRILRSLLVDGLLINYSSRIPVKMSDLLSRNRIPAIYINSKWDKNCVYPDEVAAGRLATEVLLEQGNKRIAYFDLSVGSHEIARGIAHYSVTDRERGYRHAMEKAALEPIVVREHEPVPVKERAAFLAEWLRNHPDITAIVDGPGSTTIPLLAGAAMTGRIVGRCIQVSWIGNQETTVMGAPVNRVTYSGAELGRRAAAAISRLLEKRSRPIEPTVVQPTVIPHEER